MFWFFSVGGKIVIDVRLGYIIIDGSIARVPVIAVIIPISALPHSLPGMSARHDDVMTLSHPEKCRQ